MPHLPIRGIDVTNGLIFISLYQQGREDRQRWGSAEAGFEIYVYLSDKWRATWDALFSVN
jgi:hypothetical protein